MNIPHQVHPFKGKPTQQMHQLLGWFAAIGVHRFDVHVRQRPSNINYTSDYISPDKWITCHEDIDVQKITSLWAWIRSENAHGADIYFRPHRGGCHPVIFLDDLNLAEAYRVARAYACAVVQTSDNNTQVWLKTSRPLNLEERKATQSHLSAKGFSDRKSVSGDHLGRICGLVSHKRECWVNAILFSTPRAYTPPQQLTIPHHGGGGARVSSSAGVQSASEREFGWTLGLLKSGADESIVTQKLQQTAMQRGKNDAERYARFTVQKALAILGQFEQV